MRGERIHGTHIHTNTMKPEPLNLIVTHFPNLVGVVVLLSCTVHAVLIVGGNDKCSFQQNDSFAIFTSDCVAI